MLSSVAAERARAGNAIYGAAKAGLDALAQGLADATAGSGVRVLVVRPGFVRTRRRRDRGNVRGVGVLHQLRVRRPGGPAAQDPASAGAMSPPTPPRRRITRRTVLAGAAAASAVSLMRPAVGIADAIDGASSVSSRWLGALAGESGELPAPRRFALVGVQWTGPWAARIELRTRARAGHWSPWALASVLGHAPDAPAERAPLIGEPLWSGPADFVQLRSSRPVDGVRLHFLSARLPGAAAAADALPLAQPVLDAGPGQPPIIARSAWAHGARPAVRPDYGVVRLAFVHHTENPNGYTSGEVPAMLLAIYEFHRFVRGWSDIGYNFVIDAFGRIWEARAGGIDEAVIGAQAGGYNAVSTGVAVLGSFMSVTPSQASIDSLQRLLAWKLSLHGVSSLGHVTVQVNPADAFFTPFAPGARVSLPRIAGHRDGDSTDCPGDAFYRQLPGIRLKVSQLTGAPATLTLAPSTGEATAPATIDLTGRLELPAGQPPAGAPIELQQLTAGGAATIANLTTAADGSFGTALTLSHDALLRALHRTAPSTASELVGVGIRPAIELSVDSLSPLRVSGTVSPAKRSATIDVHALGHRHRRLIASKHVAVRNGRFSATIRNRAHGRVAVRASTRADRDNAAGSSRPVVVGLP